ncbi:MAG: 50S ribosomal protein L24 [Candidatus Woesearchaeota archaeon]
MKQFSTKWKQSKKPRKQRKYRYNAPLHIKGKFLHSHLSKELRKKYGTRAIRVRKGDKVRVMRGQFRKREGRVQRVDIKNCRVYIENIDQVKKDGSKTFYPIHPSNLMVIELNLDDKKRVLKLDKFAKADNTKMRVTK